MKKYKRVLSQCSLEMAVCKTPLEFSAFHSKSEKKRKTMKEIMTSTIGNVNIS